jgi:hypothetical protein
MTQERRHTQCRGDIMWVDGYPVRIRAKRNAKNFNPWNYWLEPRVLRAVQRCWKWQKKKRKQYY